MILKFIFVINETIKNLSKNDIVIISERNERNFAPKMFDGDDNFQFFMKTKKKFQKKKLF